jgi:polyisoprenoid-binding protein YceI
MKLKYHLIAVAVLFVSFMGLLPLHAAADTYNVDSDHSFILFRIKHLGVGYAYGRLNDVSGTFMFDESATDKASFEVQVETKNVDTNHEKRDADIRSSNFFDVEKNPTINFKSSGVKKLENSEYEVSGDLTFNGMTRPLTVKASHTGGGKDPWGNFRQGFETEFTIKRTEFGMDYMLNGVSDEVNLTVSIEGIRQ